MQLSLKAVTIAGGLVWGSAILLVGLMNLAMPRYGLDFLLMTSSVYPGFHASSHSIWSVLIGTIDAFFDGAVAAFLFAWLYNNFSGHPRQA
ncbi:MAG: hypothetical protein WB780_06675 [Candidatus Acidiferrales bacterium]